jgi:uncharacterized protein HemX
MAQGRTATHQLTHAGLVLAPQRGSGRGWLAALLVVLGLAGAGAGGYVAGQLQPQDVQRLGHALRDNQGLQQALEQSKAALRISEARSQELERQIDALNQRLRECQDELTFFRKAREGSGKRAAKE